MSDSIYDKDFLCVKEFAEFSGVSASALRHYDNKGVFLPAKRENKYRYYSPTQIAMANMVRVLAEMDVPLKTIKELVQSRSPETMLKLLSKNKDIVADEIRYLQEMFSVISVFTELLSEGISITESEIAVAQMPEKRIVLGDNTDFSGETGYERELIRFCKTPHDPKLNMPFSIGGYWESMAAFVDEPSRPMRFYSLEPKGHEQRTAGLYLIGYTRGHYGQTNDLPDRMETFAKKNGLIFTGPVYSLYLFDEISIADPEQYLLQVAASVMETRRVSSRRPLRRQ